jgi:hypothetical protein
MKRKRVLTKNNRARTRSKRRFESRAIKLIISFPRHYYFELLSPHEVLTVAVEAHSTNPLPESSVDLSEGWSSWSRLGYDYVQYTVGTSKTT